MRVSAVLAAWMVVLVSVASLGAMGACGGKKPAEDPSSAESDGGPEAQEPEPPPPPPPPPKPSLYERIGKREELAGIVEELLGNVLADNRISKLFEKGRKDKNRSKQLAARMVAEFCVVAGGGSDCNYDGKPMKDAHDGMNITSAQWDAFIEDLSIAMKTRGVDDASAKELVDKLERQTKADIVATPKGK
jgi:hemoglobin